MNWLVWILIAAGIVIIYQLIKIKHFNDQDL